MEKSGDACIPKYRFGGDLLPGDIIFSTVENSSISRTIRTATNSGFSHAAIYRGEMNVLEAIGVGVTNYSIMRRGIHDKKHIRVQRLEPKLREKYAGNALVAAERYRGHGYWTAGAIKSVIGNKTPDVSGRMFCSYFIAQVFEDAGLRICPTKEPTNVTPQILLSSPHLYDVTEDVIAPIPSGLEGAFESIDCEQAESPVHKLLGIERAIVKEASVVLRARDLREPKNLDDLFAIVVAESLTENQDNIDFAISEILEKHRFTEIDIIAVRNIPSETGQFPVEPEVMPLPNLKATIGVHHELLKKLSIRLHDHSEELEAVKMIKAKLDNPPIILDLWQERTRNRHNILGAQISELRELMTELEELAVKRENDG